VVGFLASPVIDPLNPFPPHRPKVTILIECQLHWYVPAGVNKANFLSRLIHDPDSTRIAAGCRVPDAEGSNAFPAHGYPAD
jgi:hypothetical protein